MKTYLNECVPQLAALLGEDRCTFSMLSRILGGRCTKTVTDHQRVIMCLSVRPFPVWVWTAPDMTAQELHAVWAKMKAEFPPQEGYSYNVGQALADAMLKDDASLRVTVRMLAYFCREAIPPRKTPAGECSPVREDEIGLAAAWYRAMHKECALNEDIPIEAAKVAVGGYVSREAMLFWRDGGGAPVAMCGVDTDGDGAYVTHVYTPPHARRRGYAGNLVCAASKMQLDAGRTPMLYTDAEYAASNECYTQIGYRLQGRLLTIAGAE